MYLRKGRWASSQAFLCSDAGSDGAVVVAVACSAATPLIRVPGMSAEVELDAPPERLREAVRANSEDDTLFKFSAWGIWSALAAHSTK